jgi:hypothetical protein
MLNSCLDEMHDPEEVLAFYEKLCEMIVQAPFEKNEKLSTADLVHKLKLASSRYECLTGNRLA